MRDKLEAALRTSRADYTEIRLEKREATTVIYRGADLETASSVVDAGGIVRCLSHRGGWGVSTFNDRDDLAAKVDQAYRCARIVPVGEPIRLAPIAVVEARVGVKLDGDFRVLDLADKKELVREYNSLALEYDERIVDTTAVYQDSFSQITFANSEGTFIEEERPMVTVYVQAMARIGDNVQSARESISGTSGYQLALGRQDLAVSAAERAVALLAADTVKGGRYPVVINQHLAGVFVHEAFGHLSEADFVYENPKAQEMMVLGRRFGRDLLTVFDDGSVPNLRGTHPYDDEGTPTGRTHLIRNGVLEARLHSRETAARMREQPTGNARATGYRYPPIVRMTNTAIDGGTESFDSLLSGIKLGVYACDAYGGQTELENFSFSAAYAHMIRDGQIAEIVKDVVLAGNLFSTLMGIDAIGDDFCWSRAGGQCGKGQGGLPVTVGAPHVRIENVIIGGV